MVVSTERAVVEPLVEGMEIVRRLGIRVRFSGCMGMLVFGFWYGTGSVGSEEAKNLRPQLPRQSLPSARLCVVSL